MLPSSKLMAQKHSRDHDFFFLHIFRSLLILLLLFTICTTFFEADRSAASIVMSDDQPLHLLTVCLYSSRDDVLRRRNGPRHGPSNKNPPSIPGERRIFLTTSIPFLTNVWGNPYWWTSDPGAQSREVSTFFVISSVARAESRERNNRSSRRTSHS